MLLFRYMKTLFKYLSKVLFTILIILFTSQLVSAMDICPGQTVRLIWSTQGTVTSCPTTVASVGACGFTADAGNGFRGNEPVTLTSGSCTVNFRCENNGVSSNAGSDSLNVVNQASCCGTGSQVGLTVWNGSSCAAPVATAAAGNISASPNPCIIALGAANCSSTVSWTSSNTTKPDVRVDYGTLMSGEANGTVLVPWISYNGNIFELRDNNAVIDSVTVRGVCASGSVWNGSSCAAPVATAATGNISASPNPCIIVLGASNCSSTVSWTSSIKNPFGLSLSKPFDKLKANGS
jgi:hypothetical protein